MINKIQVPTLNEMKKSNRKITFLTCYDYSFATALSSTSLDLILVGDSGGMVSLGFENTNPVTMEQMINMSQSVRRGAPNKLIIGDMPKGSYEVSPELAIKNAMRFSKEADCDAIKLEGGRQKSGTVKAIVESGIAVMGHIGLTPQSASALGGYKVVGRTVAEKELLFEDAESLIRAGAFAILVESTPHGLAQELADAFDVPILGIGAGKGVDGQLLILHDLLGLYPNFRPKFSSCFIPDVISEFSKNLSELDDLVRFGRESRRDGFWELTRMAVELYCSHVREEKFPFDYNFYS